MRFADASKACMAAEPGERLDSSLASGWTSLLLHTTRAAGVSGVFETRATPDQALIVTTKGHSELECFSNGRWRRAVRSPGSCGMTPGGETDRLRWRALDGSPFETAHLFIPQSFFLSAAEEFRRAGCPSCTEPLNALGFDDAVVTHVTHALVEAMRAGEPDLYAESATQFLVTHLLSRPAGWRDRSSDRRKPGAIADRRLARVVDYMKAHYMESLPLERLAREAGVGRYHFVHLFRQRVGVTPHRFLVELRMRAAASLLGEAVLSVAEVATACGYNSAAHFATAFRRRYGQAPGVYRRAARRAVDDVNDLIDCPSSRSQP